MNKETNELELIREKLNADIALPKSLSRESIETLIENELPEKKPARGMVRRFVASAVAACLVITAVSAGFQLSRGGNNVEVEDVQQSVSDDVYTLSDYDELLGVINAYKSEYLSYWGENRYYYTADDKAEEGSIIFEPSLNGGVAAGGAVSSDQSFGQINLREENVLEADIFITDGEYLYCVDGYGRGISVIKPEKDGTLTAVYTEYEPLLTDQRGSQTTISSGLYKYENYLISVFTRYAYDENYKADIFTGAKIYDVTDKSAPVVVREFLVDGNYVSSRIVDGKLILISRYEISSYFYTDDDTYFIPASYNGSERVLVPCDCIVYKGDTSPEAYVNVASVNLGAVSEDMSVASYLGRAGETYCTEDALYVIGYEYEAHSGNFGFATAVMIGSGKAVITRLDITSSPVRVTAECTLEGTLLNSYSIDEHEGLLRVALNSQEGNSIVVLDESLTQVGKLSGIAPGEQIKSARFMGDTAYLVTFVQTDPLFVIDLKNPQKPEILGEVKLPGFSEYLHPVGDGLLLGVGVGGTETGTDGTAKISLFDVSVPASPEELDNIILPGASLSSEPKSFCQVDENSFLIIYDNWELLDESEENGEYKCHFFSGCLMISVDDGAISCEHSYLVKGDEPVVRATFIGDKIYVLAHGSAGVASFDMTDEQIIDVWCRDGENGLLSLTRDKNEILFGTAW